MEEREGKDRREHEETADEYQSEQQSTGIGETAEKAVTAAVRTGLKISEAKEKLVIAKENKKLRTDRKSENFHRDKRNTRFQAERLSADDDNIDTDMDSEDIADNIADDNAAEADNAGDGRRETREADGQEVKPETDDKNKKAMRRKMRERMREQRQREFPAERYYSADRYKPYYNEGTADFDEYGDYDGYEEYGISTDFTEKSSEPTMISNSTEDINADADSGRAANEHSNKDDKTYEIPKSASYRHKDDKTKLINSDKTNIPGKLNIESMSQGLKQDKTEVKLKTDNRVISAPTPDKPEAKPEKRRLKRRRKRNSSLTEQKSEMKTTRLAHTSTVSKLITDNGGDSENLNLKPNPKKLKYRKRQQNRLVTQKYKLKNARLTHASAVSKLITNSGEENGGQNNGYAEQEQDNLNKNLINTASTGLKSVIADYKAFEADLFPKDNNKDSQKEFIRKKQRKERYIRKKAEKTAESKREAETAKLNIESGNAYKLTNEAVGDCSDGGVIDYTLNNPDGGGNNGFDYSLKDRSGGDSLNRRDSGGSNNLNSRNNKDSLKRHGTADSGDSDVSDTAKRCNADGSNANAESPKTENSVNLNHERQKKKAADNAYKKRAESNGGRNTAADIATEKRAAAVPKTDGDSPKTVSPSDTANDTTKKPSRLKHDKTPHSRKSNPTAITSEKLKFSKDNASWHGQRNEKLRPGSNKVKRLDNASTTAPLAKKKEADRRKTAQKTHNKKAMRKRAVKNKQKLAENTLRYGKRTGTNAAKQTLEAVKFLARLILQKLVALVLFLIGQIFTIGAFIMIPVIIIAVIGVIFFGTAGTMLLTSYLADDETLTEVTVYYSDKETDLIESLTEDNIKAEYGVDEVNFILVDNIGHNPHYLLSYLTAKYQEFTFSQVRSELDAIFGLQYTKTVTVRTVEVPILDGDGEPTGDTETRTVADVTLTNNGFYDILYSRLTSDEREHFLLLLEMSGNRQYGGFPMSWDWLINVTEDFNNQNNGVEAEVPENTAVYGTISGEIVNTAADSVSIQGTIGEDVIIITFSNLNSVTVDAGDTVEMTTVVGYTSDRIFIQIQRNGVYVNPVLFLGSQRQDLVYGTTIPPLTQSEFNDLTDFASDALGTPYVFGASNPPDSTDCSGFIWWAYDGGGIKSWDRTTAQGQFNQCDPITFSDARPGDLVFFQGTYDTKDSRIVTHVGIYLGNGEMQHSGTPNQITSINTSYWQEHFYSFGRLRR